MKLHPAKIPKLVHREEELKLRNASHIATILLTRKSMKKIDTKVSPVVLVFF